MEGVASLFTDRASTFLMISSEGSGTDSRLSYLLNL